MLVAFSFLAFGAWRHPGFAVVLVWSVYGLEQVLSGQSSYILQQGSLVNAVVAIVAVLAAVKNPLLSLNKVFATSEFIGAIALIGFLAISTFWAADVEFSQAYLIEYSPQLLAYGLVVPFCIVGISKLNKIMLTTIIFGGLVLTGMFFSDYGFRGVSFEKIGGTIVEANPLAAASFGGYVAICCVFSLVADFRQKRWGDASRFLVVMKFLTLPLAMYIIVRSGSLGQFAASLLAIVIWLPIAMRVSDKRSRLFNGILLAIALMAVVIWMVDTFEWNFRWRWSFIVQSTIDRQDLIFPILAEYFKGGPFVWLVGLGSSSSQKLVGGYPHNVPVEVLVETGLVGISIFGYVFWNAFTHGLRMVRSPKIPHHLRIHVCALLCLMTFELIVSLKQSNIVCSSTLFSFALMVGWIYVVGPGVSNNKMALASSTV